MFKQTSFLKFEVQLHYRSWFLFVGRLRPNGAVKRIENLWRKYSKFRKQKCSQEN